MEALTARKNDTEERISDIEDQMTENKEAEQKRDNSCWTTRGEFER